MMCPVLSLHLRTVVIAASLTSLCATGCAGGGPLSAPLAPSPAIVPDAVTLSVGAEQIFVVQDAAVVRFDVKADGQRWSDCVDLDATAAATNSVRVIARHRCRGPVYVSANIGEHRSPLVALVVIE